MVTVWFDLRKDHLFTQNVNFLETSHNSTGPHAGIKAQSCVDPPLPVLHLMLLSASFCNYLAPHSHHFHSLPVPHLNKCFTAEASKASHLVTADAWHTSVWKLTAFVGFLKCDSNCISTEASQSRSSSCSYQISVCVLRHSRSIT